MKWALQRGFINVLMEISDKKNLESVAKDAEILSKTLGTLKNSEQRYQLMISEIQDYAIILLSKDGIIEEWNSGDEKIKGYTAAEAVGQHVRIFYTPVNNVVGG